MVNLEAIFHGHNFICMIILAYHHTYVHNSIFQLQQIVASKGRIRTRTNNMRWMNNNKMDISNGPLLKRMGIIVVTPDQTPDTIKILR